MIREDCSFFDSVLQDDSSLVIKHTIPIEIHTGMDTGTGAAESPETLWEFFDYGHQPLPCAASRSPVNEASTSTWSFLD